jgi:hypothetical protein
MDNRLTTLRAADMQDEAVRVFCQADLPWSTRKTATSRSSRASSSSHRRLSGSGAAARALRQKELVIF